MAKNNSTQRFQISPARIAEIVAGWALIGDPIDKWRQAQRLADRPLGFEEVTR
jgi:hypothetical protein